MRCPLEKFGVIDRLILSDAVSAVSSHHRESLRVHHLRNYVSYFAIHRSRLAWFAKEEDEMNSLLFSSLLPSSLAACPSCPFCSVPLLLLLVSFLLLHIAIASSRDLRAVSMSRSESASTLPTGNVALQSECIPSK